MPWAPKRSSVEIMFAPSDRALTAAEQRNDIVLAVVLFVGAIISAWLSAVSGIYGDEQQSFASAVLYSAIISAPLAVRRRWPSIVAIVVCTAYFAAVSLRVPELYAGNIAMFISLYTVGAWLTNRQRAMWVRVGIIIGMGLWLTITMFQQVTSPAEAGEGFSRAGAFSPLVAFNLLTLLINALYFGGAYFFGEKAWASRQQREALEQRTAELEIERELSAAQAVALERVRIARELHDVVAHHVSLMGVQAGAARTVMDRNPDAARAAMAQVEASARTAITELRQLLVTLRDSDLDVSTTPTTVGLDALPALVAEATAAGLPSTLSVIGDEVPVSSTVAVNLYRIAQEALTNARRHAGPTATADVRLRYSQNAVELEVANTGRRITSTPARGLGQVGMRERATASNGVIEIGPRESGGWLVRIRIPIAEVSHV